MNFIMLMDSAIPVNL